MTSSFSSRLKKCLTRKTHNTQQSVPNGSSDFCKAGSMYPPTELWSLRSGTRGKTPARTHAVLCKRFLGSQAVHFYCWWCLFHWGFNPIISSTTEIRVCCMIRFITAQCSLLGTCKVSSRCIRVIRKAIAPAVMHVIWLKIYSQLWLSLWPGIESMQADLGFVTQTSILLEMICLTLKLMKKSLYRLHFQESNRKLFPGIFSGVCSGRLNCRFCPIRWTDSLKQFSLKCGNATTFSVIACDMILVQLSPCV